MNYTGTNPPSNPKTKAVVIIPARYDSVRLPGKALLEINGTPMICRVAARAQAARNISRVIVATDDERIAEAVRHAGFEAVITAANHKSGTDRLAEVAEALTEPEIIVNVQGDEPLISPSTIERAVDAMGEAMEEKGKGEVGTESFGIVTTWEPMESAADVLNPNVVKIVVDEQGQAIYFSRSPVPYPRQAVREHGSIELALESEPGLLSQFRKHTGLYVYRRDVLLEFTRWAESPLEKMEALEQLRALEHGVKIKAIQASEPSIGVDTLEDLERVRMLVELGFGGTVGIEYSKG